LSWAGAPQKKKIHTFMSQHLTHRHIMTLLCHPQGATFALREH